MYQGPHAAARGRGARWLRRTPWLLLLVSISAEVAWTGPSAPTRDRLFAVMCLAAFAAVALQAAFERSPAWALGLVLGAGGAWFLADLLNCATDLPFGHVRYTHRIGPLVAGVPILLLALGVAITYVALLGARRVAKATLLVAVLGAMYIAAADVALQSLLQHFGYLHWSKVDPTLPGVPGIPAQDFVGTLLVGVLVLLLLNLLPPTVARDGVPRLLFGWRYLADVVAAAVVLSRPDLAIVTALVGGALAIPYGYLLFVDRV